jgi:hypothetical protein
LGKVTRIKNVELNGTSFINQGLRGIGHHGSQTKKIVPCKANGCLNFLLWKKRGNDCFEINTSNPNH